MSSHLGHAQIYFDKPTDNLGNKDLAMLKHLRKIPHAGIPISLRNFPGRGGATDRLFH